MAGPSPTRRAFIGSAGSVALTAIAGCSAPVGSQSTTARSTATATTDANPYARVYHDSVESVVLVQITGGGIDGQGSGFVIDQTGHVLTNQHVVARAERIDLRYADGTWRSASIVGSDVYSDLAVLSPDGQPASPPLPSVEDQPAIGTEVVAIGSPFGLEESLSRGIVSGVGRAIPTRAGFTIPASIQTDAAVNPGNSGGPLVTLDGDVVGVIRSGGGDNIGFAISAALVQRVAPALIETGAYEHAYMGVGILNVSPTVAEANDLDRDSGVLITRVLEDGPSDGVLQGSPTTAEIAGVEVPVGGDIVIAMGGQPIPTGGALGRYLALETRPGQTIGVDIVRDGEELTVDLTVGARPPPEEVIG